MGSPRPSGLAGLRGRLGSAQRVPYGTAGSTSSSGERAWRTAWQQPAGVRPGGPHGPGVVPPPQRGVRPGGPHAHAWFRLSRGECGRVNAVAGPAGRLRLVRSKVRKEDRAGREATVLPRRSPRTRRRGRVPPLSAGSMVLPSAGPRGSGALVFGNRGTGTPARGEREELG